MKSKLLQVMRDRHEKTMRHVAHCLKVKAAIPIENQMDWLRNHQVEYFIGMADGANNMLEDALHSSKEYKGFHYIYFNNAKSNDPAPEWVPRTGDDITKEHEFQEWCRLYH